MHALRRISASLSVPSCLALAALLIWIPLSMGVSSHAQSSAQSSEQGAGLPVAAAAVIPQQVRYTGKLANRAGETVEAVFSIYAAPEGGEPLWTETQQVAVASDGSYAVLLGSTDHKGLPQAVFAAGAARWLGVSVERAPELDRVPLASVPYAMKSADAEALAGHAAADFVTQEQLSQLEAQRASAPTPAITSNNPGTVTGSGTAGTIPLWTGSLTQGNSDMIQVGSEIGINEATPAATLDVGGSEMVRGELTLPAMNTATTSSGYDSQILQFNASAWSTTAGAAVTPTFRLYANPVNNNTANASATFRFQYQLGATSTTVLSFGSNGVLITNGGLTMSPVSGATYAAGVNSPQLELGASAWSSGSSSAVAQRFDWQVLATGNNTPSPSSNLALLYAFGTHTPGATGLSISPTGIVNWAPGQTFPITGTGGGTITGITTTSPLTGSGTSGSVAIGLNESALVTDIAPSIATAILPTITPSLETTFNGVYAQLSGENTFTAGQIFEGVNSMTGTNESGPELTVTNSGDSFSTGISVSNGGQYGIGLSASASSDGDGIEGFGTQTAGSIGVLGALANSNGFSNSFFLLESDDGLNAGMWADGANGQEAALIATSDDLSAGIFFNDSSASSTILVINNFSGGPTGNSADRNGSLSGGIATVLRAGGPGGTCGINQTGNLSCTGQVKSVVSTPNGAKQMETYSVQSAENWIEDYGSGQLNNGSATVIIETAFAETVNTGVEFHVFLTPGGDCKGLYVTNKTASSFEVHELGGGTSSIPFDYKIVAKRRGFETQRLVDVTDRMRVEADAAKKKQLAQPLPRTRLTMPAMGARKHGTAGTTTQ